MSYIHCLPEITLQGYIGDSPDKLWLELFSDADLASDKDNRKSTSGIFLVLRGPNSFFPIQAISKKQGCVAYSTPEAELVAANAALRMVGLPALDFWETVLGRKVLMILNEDNETAITVIRSGKNSTMRHMQRTQDVCAKWLTNIFSRFYDVLFLRHCPSPDMCADLITKPVTNSWF